MSIPEEMYCDISPINTQANTYKYPSRFSEYDESNIRCIQCDCPLFGVPQMPYVFYCSTHNEYYCVSCRKFLPLLSSFESTVSTD